VFGCRRRFGADGPVLSWWCARGCSSGGEKTYASADEASRMAAVLDREPRPLGFLAILGGTLHRDERPDRDRT
jgi:hypothetical protein